MQKKTDNRQTKMTEAEIINVDSIDKLADHGIDRIAIAIGVFDGVHLGHRCLLQKVVEMADQTGTTPGVLTFFPHPRQVLSHEQAVHLITTQHQKTKLIHDLGIEAVITIPFTKEFASMSSESFLENCCSSPRVRVSGICVGSQWRFGKEGKGDVETLRGYAEEKRFMFEAVEEKVINGEIVSSTTIRRAIASGCLDKAEQMLGRPFRIFGKVIHGRHIASRELSYPTANIQSYNGISPPNGVYAGYAIFDTKKYPSAIVIGVSPTFHFAENNKPIKIEVHITGFTGDLYGKELEIELVRYLREERCYTSVEKLKEQICSDLESVRKALV